jgi:hypothetical protein
MTRNIERVARRELLVTVVIATYQGDQHIRRTLDSLSAQTMPPDLFEILVVSNGPVCRTPLILEDFRTQNPIHRLRTVSIREASVSQARNAGVWSALGKYITFVDDDDTVSANYLATLTDAARDGVIPAAFIADVVGGRTDYDFGAGNYYSRSIIRHADSLIRVEQAPEVLSPNVAKLIPTAVAREVAFHRGLRSGEDFVFWTELFAKTQFLVYVTDPRAQAVYYRTVRQGSVSRQAPSYDYNVVQRLDCVAALNRLTAPNSVVARVIRNKIDVQLDQVAHFLQLLPDTRAQATADMRERRLNTAQHQRLNRGLARDLALLYCFAPYQDTSALVAARRIRERGVIVDVVTNRLEKLRAQDDLSTGIAADHLDSVATVNAPQAMGDWRSIRLFVDQAARRIAEMERRKGAYRTVYSRAMWPASHFAAAIHKVQNPGCHWIAEFSDPMLYDIHGAPRIGAMARDHVTDLLGNAMVEAGFGAEAPMQLWDWVERIAYAFADEIVFTNDNQRAYMLHYCADDALAQRASLVSVTSPQPTLPSEFYRLADATYALDHRRINIGYFGRFYATRGLGEVLEALRLSRRAQAGVHLHVFTEDREQMTPEIARMGLQDSVSVQPFQPFLEFLNLTTRFDVLLVNDAFTADTHAMNPYMPSKLSDYLGSGRDIWAIVEDGSALSQTDVAFKSKLGDVGGAADVLEEISRLR